MVNYIVYGRYQEMVNLQLLVVSSYVLYVTIISVCHPADVKYTGCMVPENLLELWKSVPEGQDPGEDAQLRGPFSHRAVTGRQLSVQTCVLRCWTERFKFAAMQGGSHCYCSSHVQELMTVKEWFCRERCVGTCKQMCGGRVAMSVYETGYEKEPQQVLSFSNDIVKESMVGCYYKTGEARLCSATKGKPLKPAIKSGRMTPQLCALYCAAGGEKMLNDVAAITAPDTCCCSNDGQMAAFGRDLQRAYYSQCNVPCVGGSHTACVGELVVNGRVEELMSVYLVPRMLRKGMPQVPAAVFQTDNGWLYPRFVENYDISEEDLIKEAKELEKTEVGVEKETEETNTNWTLGEHRTKQPSGPIVYPVNTGAQVNDVPKEVRAGGFNVTVVGGVTVSILVFGASIAYAFRRRKTPDVSEKSPGDKTEEQKFLMDEVNLQLSDQDGGFEESSETASSQLSTQKRKSEPEAVDGHLESSPLL